MGSDIDSCPKPQQGETAASSPQSVSPRVPLAGESKIPLARLWEDLFTSLPARVKFRLVEDLARWVRAEHDAGRTLPADPLSGILVENPGRGADFAFGGSGRRLLKIGDWRLRDLARLYAPLLPRLSRNTRWRFLNAYWREGGSASARLAFGKRLDRLARRRASRRWRQAEAACLGSGPGFVSGKRGGRRYFCRDTAEAEGLLRELLADPERVMERGTRLPGRGNSCLTVKIESAGRSYVLKRYNRRGWVYSARHVLRRSRALRAWVASWGFRARGAYVPDPILCLEERSFRFLGHSYILSRYLEDAPPLSRTWGLLSPEEKQESLIRLALLYGRLHSLGGIHGDTNWDNILVGPSPGREGFYLIDMDCSRVFRRTRSKKVCKDIKHVFRDLRRLSPKEPELERLFRRVWERWADVGRSDENQRRSG